MRGKRAKNWAAPRMGTWFLGTKNTACYAALILSALKIHATTFAILSDAIAARFVHLGNEMNQPVS